MAGYKDRLKRLNASYGKTKPTKPSGFSDLPKGSYQFSIKAVKMIQESKANFALGELELQVFPCVLTGEHKGVMGKMNFFLEQPAKRSPDGTEQPSGLSRFKGVVEAMGISLPELSDKALASALREMRDMKFNGYCTGKFNNVYFNSPLDAEDMEIDDSEFEDEEDEEEEEDEDEEEEVEEAPKPEPVRKKRTSKKSSTKKKTSAASKPESSEGSDGEPDDDDDFDFDDF